MDAEAALGLAADLWAVGRDREPLRTALNVAHALHWVPRVRAALHCNREAGRFPGSFKDLASVLERNSRNLHRWKAGEQQAVVADYLALAARLEIPVGDLFPPLEWWISHAALNVCGSRVTMTDSLRYGAYLSRRPVGNNGSLDPQAVEYAMIRTGEKESPNTIETSVLRAAKAVGGSLLQAGWSLSEFGRIR